MLDTLLAKAEQAWAADLCQLVTPHALLAAAYQFLSSDKYEPTAENLLEEVTVDIFWAFRDLWLDTVAEWLNTHSSHLLATYHEQIMQRLAQIDLRYWSDIQCEDDPDSHTLRTGYSLSVLLFHQIDQQGQLPDFSLDLPTVTAWLAANRLALPDRKGRYKMF